MRKGLGFVSVLAFGLLIGGCAMTNWQKAGGSHDQYAKDVAECGDKSDLPAVTPGTSPIAGSIIPYSYELEKSFNKCMTGKGYKMGKM